MLRTSVLPAMIALCTTGIAHAESPASSTPTTTIVVKGTRATYTLPTGNVPNPPKPEFALRLPPYNLDSIDYNFPSGLRVILQADHSQPVVSVTAVYDRGSTSDPVGKEGIAHFVEHLWFRSRHTDPTTGKLLPKVWDILSDLGCNLNASTADDWTNYMSSCPATSLDSLLRLESLRISHTVDGVEERVVETEREVIKNELRMRYENEWATVLPYVFDRLYPEGHPYRRLGIGSHESLNNVHLADIQQFVKTNYTAANSTIVVVGDFDIQRAAELIYDNFDYKLLDPRADSNKVFRVPRRGVDNPDPKKPEDWFFVPADPNDPTKPLSPQGQAPKRVAGPAAEPPKPGDQSIGTYKAAVENPSVVLAWTVPGAYHGNDWVYRLMANIAGGYMTSYFRDNDANVKANESGCFLWDSKVDSKVLCQIQLRSAEGVDPKQIAQKAVDQIAFMWNSDYNYDPVNNVKYMDLQLSRFRMESLASTLQSLDLFATIGGGRATDIAHHAHFTGSAAYHSDAMQEVMHVTGEQITEAAYKYLRRDRVVTVFLKPFDKDELAHQDSTSGYHGSQGGDSVIRSTIDPKEITADVIKDYTITPDTESLLDTTLPNGLRVVVYPHGEAPLVEAGLLVFGGDSNDSKPGLDAFVSTFSTTVWNDINRTSDPLRIAGSWGLDSGPNYTYHYLQSANGNLDGSLWLLRQAVDNMRPSLDGKSDYIKTAQSHLKTDWKYRDGYYGTGYVTSQRMEQVNPGHRLSRTLGWDDYEAMKLWKSADIEQYLATKYQPANAVLLIVGNVDGKQAQRLAEYYLQGWQPKPGTAVGRMPELTPPNAATAASRVVLFDDPKKTQTGVTFVCPVAPATPTNDAARQVLGDYLDEQAWIILRENGGVTYGANAMVAGYPGGTSYLYMSSLVQNNGTPLAVKTFVDLAAKAKTGEFQMDRVKLHQLNRGKRYVTNQQSVPQMRGRLLGQLYWKNDWSVMTHYADRLAAIDAAALKAQMGDCTDHSIVTVEGPVAELKPMLDEAGVRYEVFDWKQAGKDMLAKYDPKAAAKAAKAEAEQKAKEEKKAEATPPAK